MSMHIQAGALTKEQLEQTLFNMDHQIHKYSVERIISVHPTSVMGNVWAYEVFVTEPNDSPRRVIIYVSFCTERLALVGEIY